MREFEIVVQCVIVLTTKPKAWQQLGLCFVRWWVRVS